jgi:hypothetical protein
MVTNAEAVINHSKDAFTGDHLHPHASMNLHTCTRTTSTCSLAPRYLPPSSNRFALSRGPPPSPSSHFATSPPLLLRPLRSHSLGASFFPPTTLPPLVSLVARCPRASFCHRVLQRRALWGSTPTRAGAALCPS